MFHIHNDIAEKSRGKDRVGCLAKLVVASLAVFPMIANAGLEGDSMPSSGGGDYKPSAMMPIEQVKGSDSGVELKRRARYRLEVNDFLSERAKEEKKIVFLNQEAAFRRPLRISMSMEK